jgi:hypothetical protein
LQYVNRYMKRLILFTILFLISLLAVFKAPTYHLWLLSILVTEYCWVFIIVTVVLLIIAGFRPCKYRIHATVIGVISLVLFCSPILRAYKVANDLQNGFTKVFGPEDVIVKPFQVFKMFTDKPDEIKYSTKTYATYADTSLTLDF